MLLLCSDWGLIPISDLGSGGHQLGSHSRLASLIWVRWLYNDSLGHDGGLEHEYRFAFGARRISDEVHIIEGLAR